MSYGCTGTVSGDTTRKLGEILRDRGFKVDQWGHWHYGPYRFQMKRGVCKLGRKIEAIGRSAYSSIASWYYGKIRLEKFAELADRIVAKVKEARTKAAAERPATDGVGVQVTENEQKDGVEIRFAEKPDQSVIEQVKSHGFRWSKFQKLWYARRSEETLAFAYGLVNKPAPNLPEGPDMSTILDGEQPGETEPTAEGQDAPQVPAEDPNQLKVGGFVNNPEYREAVPA
ncbi:MAG: hypothetical protein AMXMBFR13_06960 [Phycisphaerae bacterium]